MGIGLWELSGKQGPPKIGSIPIVSTIYFGFIVQWLECRPVTAEVAGSNPAGVAIPLCEGSQGIATQERRNTNLELYG